MLHKYLEKTYKKAVAESKPISNAQELEAFWEKYCKEGDIAGGYWATMTHKEINDPLGKRIFGDVHMMSHNIGRQWQSDVKELKLLRKSSIQSSRELAEKDRQLAKLRKRLAGHEKEIAESTTKQKQLHIQLESYKEKVEILEDKQELKSLKRTNRDLEKSLHDTNLRCEMLLEQNELASNAFTKQMASRSEFDEIKRQLELMEWQLENALNNKNDDRSDQDNIGDLCGRCVLYVGGQTRCRSSFRQLVELMNGEFLYHDGGIEDSRQRLNGLLTRADAVICPASCISHSAANKIKQACGRDDKQMIWLRSASLAAFHSALHDVKLAIN